MQICTFPECTKGDTGVKAFRACTLCMVNPPRYDEHVWAWRQYRQRLRGFWAGLSALPLYRLTGS